MHEIKRFNLEMANKDLERDLSNANSLSFGIRNLLITLTTFLITFSSPLLINTENIEDTCKVLLYISWIFGTFSVLAGLTGFFVDIGFFQDAAALHKKISVLITRSGDTTEEINACADKVNEIADTGNMKSSSNIPVMLQVTFWILQLIFLLITLSFMLFG